MKPFTRPPRAARTRSSGALLPETASRPVVRPVAAAVALAVFGLQGYSIRVANANPTGGQVTAGAATIQQSGTQTLINQSTNRAAIDWNGFSIGAGESVVFRQPSAASVALNRVVGPNPSEIYGSLQANGQVFLINPSGILFGRGASVDVAGLVASTANIGNADFMAGRNVFTGAGTGRVVNEGDIRVQEGGYVALLGNQVSNAGSITAPKGSVALGAGDSMTLDFNGDGLLSLRVNAAAAGAKIDHSGVIVADGGRVIMSARAKNALLDTVLNVDGVVQAHGVVERNGQIYLEGGDSGVTRVAGTLDASSSVPGGKGGDVRVLGEYVGLFDRAKVDASGAAGGGTVLVGGDFQGRNPDVRNAAASYVGRDVDVRADAVQSGDGGRIIVWSDGSTRAHGSFSARGGVASGHGGLIETSGHEYLDAAGARVDTRAGNGAAGTWLLDPRNVTIAHAATTGTSDAAFDGGSPTNTFAPGGNDSTVTDADINQRLLTTNVKITTSPGAGAQAGDVTVNSDALIFNGASQARTFNITADGSIAINAGARIGLQSAQDPRNVGALNVELVAADTITHNGSIVTTPRTPATASFGTNGSNGDPGGSLVLRAGAITGAGTISTSGADGAESGAQAFAARTIGGNGGSAGEIFMAASAPGGILLTGAITAAGGAGGVGSSASAVAGNGGNGGNGGVVTIRSDGGPMTLGAISTAAGSGGAAGFEPFEVPAGPPRPGVAGTRGVIQLLSAGGAIAQSGAFDARSLKVISDSDATLQNPGNNVDILAGRITGAGKAFDYSNNGTLTIGTVPNGLGTLDGGTSTTSNIDAVSGVTTNGGTISLSANAANSLLSVTAPLAGTAGVTLTGDRMTLGTSIDAGTATATLRPLTAGRAIDVGSGSDVAANTLELSSPELNGVTAGTLVVGRGEAGALTVSSGIAPSNASNLQLITGSSAAINAGVTVTNSLTVTAGTDITVASGQTIGRTGTGAGAARFNAGDDVSLIGATIQQVGGTAGTDKLNVVFNANSDDSAGGSIAAIGASSVLTRGGDITFGGRETTLTGAVTGTAGGASAIGVMLSGATLDAGGGSVSIFGQGGTTASSNHGISLNSTTVSGNAVSLSGTGGSAGSNNIGVVVSGGTMASSGNIDITGTAGAGASSALSINSAATIGNAAMAGDILFRSLGGGLTLDGTIVNDRGAGHDVTINASGGSVTQSAGSRITAGGLRLIGQAASFDFAGAANDVTVLAGAVTAPLTLTNAQPLTIGALTTNDGTSSSTSTGISTNGGGLDINNTGALTVNAAISTTPAAAGVAGGSVKLVSTGAIASDANGSITSSGSDSGGGAAGAGGDVLVRSTGAGDITLGAAIAAKGGNAPVAGSAGAGGVVTLLNDSGAISVSSIDASAGGGFGGGAAGAIQLQSTGGAISQAASSVLAGGTLKVLGDSMVTLTESGNAVGTIAGNGANFAFTNSDSGGLTVGSIGATTNLGVTTAAANGITTTAGDITLRASGGTLTVGSGNVNAGSASALLSANGMAFTGTVTGHGGVTLAPAADGTPIVLGATGVGKPVPLSLENALLGQVRTTGVLTIGTSTSGAISIDGAIAGSPATWNTLSLVTGDAIANAAGVSPLITANALALHAVNGIGSSATPLRTAVSNMAFSNSGIGGVTIDNTGALTLGNVADITTGANAGSGALALTMHSPVTIAADLIQTGDITITAGDVAGTGDDLTVNAGVTVRSTGSAAGQGNVTLTAGDNIVLNTGSKVESRAGDFLPPTGGKRVTLTAGSGNEQGTITGSGVVLGETVVLDALTGIGSAATRVATSASILAARTRTSGDVFVSNVGSVTLNTIDGTIVNAAGNGGAYDVTAGGGMTVAGAVNSTGATGRTTLTTTGIGDIVVNAAAGNASSTTTLVAAGSITGSGTVTGATVVLDADAAIGSSANRLNTAAGTLAARTRSIGGSEGGRGVFVSETDGVTLATVGSVANGTANNAEYNVIAGGAMAIGGPVVTSGGAVSLQSTSGAVTSTAAGTITTSASGRSGAVRITAATSIDLLGDVITKSIRSFAPASRGGDVTFSGPGGLALSMIDTSGSGSDSIAGGAAAGDIAFGTPASIMLRGNITARGGDGNLGFGTAGNGANLAFGAPVTLGGDVTIDTRAGSNAATAGTAGTVTFSGTIDSPTTARALTVTTPAQIAFGGAVGGASPLASVTTNGGGAVAVNGGGVSTTGVQAYDNTVTIGGAAGSSALFSGSALSFNGSPALSAGSHPLTLTTNTLAFGGNVTGTSTLLIQPTADDKSIGIAGAGGDLTLTTADHLNRLQNGFSAITLGRATSSAATTVGTATFQDPVTIRGGSVVVNGNITGNDDASITLTSGAGGIALGADLTTSNQAIALNGAVTLSGANRTLSAGSDPVTFSGTIDGASNLTVSSTGATTFNGAIGGATALSSLTTDAGGTTAINGGSVTTIGDQRYNDAVTLGANTTLTGATPVFGGTVTGGGNDLTLNFTGTTNITGAFTGIRNLASGNGGTTTLSGTIATGGSQTYTDAVSLAGNTTLTGTAGSLTGGVTGNGNDLTLGLGGLTTLGGGIAGVRNLASNGGGTTSLSGNIETSGTQAYSDAVTLGGTTTLASTGAGAAGDITLAAVDGAQALTVNTGGTTTFGGWVGRTTPLVSVTTDAPGTTAINIGGINNEGIATSGTQTYNDAVILGANPRLSSSGSGAAGNITFAKTLESSGSPHRIELSTRGTVTFNDAVGGGGNPLRSLSVLDDVTGTAVAVNGGSVTTTESQTYSYPVILGADTAFTSTGAGPSGAIVFRKTVQSDGTPRALTVNTAGQTAFSGAVGGGGNPLSSVTTDAGGITTIEGGVTTTGTQTYNDVVTLTGGNITLTSTGAGAAGDITFAAGLDSSLGGISHGITVNTAGTTTFDGAVTGNWLAFLTTDAPGATVLNAGTIATTGAQSYADAVTLGTDTTLTSTGAGDITLTGAVNGARTLTVNTAGQTRLNTIGNTAALTSVTTDAPGSTVLGGDVTTVGAQVYNDAVGLAGNARLTGTTGSFGSTIAGNGNDLALDFSGSTSVGAATFSNVRNFSTGNGGTTTLSGTIATIGTQTYGDAVILAGDTTLSAAANAVTFGSTVDGASNLAINSTGATTFAGAVGGTTALASLITNPGGTTAINGGVVRTTGDQTYNDAVTLGTNTTLTGAAGMFGATVAGAGFDLTLNYSGTSTIDGARVTGVRNLTTGDGGTTNLIGVITTTGTQTYGDAVTLAGDATANAGANAVTFGSTVDGGSNLTINSTGATTFTGALGGATPLASLTSNAGGTTALDGGVVRTTGDQTYNDAVTLGANTTLTGAAGTFGSTVTGAGFDLTLNYSGANTIDGARVTGVRNLATGNGGTTTLIGTLTTGGAQIYGDAVTLGGTTTLVSTGAGAAGDITLGAVDGAQSLTVNASGKTTFGGSVGGATPLAAVTTDAPGSTVINADTIVTTGAQTYGDNVVLARDAALRSTAGGTISFNGSVNSLSAGGCTETFISGPCGGAALTVQTAGTVRFGDGTGDDRVGAAQLLQSLSVDGGSIVFSIDPAAGRSVTTFAKQTYTGPVVLARDTAFNSLGLVRATASEIVFESADALTFRGTVDSQTAGSERALRIGTDFGLVGEATFEGRVGSLVPLARFDADLVRFNVAGGNTTLTTLGSQRYGNVRLSQDTIVRSTGAGANGDVTFAGTLNSANAGAERALTVQTAGNTRFDNPAAIAGASVGAAVPLLSLSTDAPGSTFIRGTINTVGDQTYGDAVTVGAAGAPSGPAAVLLNAGAGNVTFMSSVNGNGGLTVNASGATTFNGAVGNLTPLDTLTTDAAGVTRIDGGSVRTVYAQRYNDAVELGADAVLSVVTPNVPGGGQPLFRSDIVFGASLDGSYALTVNTPHTTSFRTVGGTAALASLDTDAPGTTEIRGGSVRTAGAQRYDDAVTIGANTLLTSTGGGDITLGDSTAGAFTLTINSAGNTRLGGNRAGTTVDLASLTTDAPGATQLYADSITTTGAQTFNDPVQVGGVVTTLTSTGAGEITFRDSIRALNDFAGLTVNTGGTTRFGGPVGSGIAALSFLTTDAGGTTIIEGGAVNTLGAQTYNDAVILGANTVLTARGGDIALMSGVDGAFGLTVNTPLTSTFRGFVGGSVPLASLTTNAGGTTAINGGSVRTTGDQNYNDAVALGANTTLTGAAGTFGSTVAGAGFDLTLNYSGANAIDGARVTGVRNLSTGNGGTTSLTGLVTTTGTQTYGDAVTLAGDTTAGAGANAVTFRSTVNGASSLTVNSAGATTFAGAVGGTTALASLTTNAGGTTAINGGAVTTTGAQTYGDDVTLGANTVLNAGAGSITFAAKLDAPATPRALTVNSTGAVTFGGLVGSTAPLASISTNAGGTTRVETTGITTTGNQSYGDAVIVGANATLTSSAGNITFGSSIDADTAANNRTLAINAALGKVTFSGSVGANAAFADLDVVASPNTIVFNGSQPQTVNVTAGGGNAVTFTGNVELDQNVTINTGGPTSNSVQFMNGIETAGAANRTLTINAGAGDVTLQSVGNATPLAMLATNGNLVSFNQNAAAQQVFIGANRILTNGNGTISATLPFAGYDGPAALTLTGPASGGVYGGEASMLRVDVPGLLVVTPNTSRIFPTVWLQGDPATKPFYQFYDDAAFREVVYNGRPVSTSSPNLITDPQQTREILRQVNEIETAGAASLASADAAADAREPEACTAADAKGDAVLACAQDRPR